MSAVGLYEQIKDDLGYLQLDRAGEVFATLAEQARNDDWTHTSTSQGSSRTRQP